MKVLVWSGIVGATSAGQNLAEDTDCVLREFGPAQEFETGLVVADDVPTVDGELAAEMGPEFRHLHLATRPPDDRPGIAFEDLLQQGAQLLLFGTQGPAQFVVRHGLPGCLALLE